MFDRIRTLISRLQDVKEVNSLTDRDLMDLGLSRDQVLGFLKMPNDISERVAAMGQVFGVPELELKRDHGQWVDLLTVCGHCADRAACAHVLAKGDLAEPSEAKFCGNRATFAEFAV